MPAVNHRIVSFFHARDQLAQAAELAADKATGAVDLNKVPAHLRPTLEAVAGNAFTVTTLAQKLDAGLNEIDRFDVGAHGGRGVPATGGCGSRTGAEERVAAFRSAQGTLDPPQSAFASFLATITGRQKTASNLALDPAERQKLEATGSPAAKAMLALLDAQAAAPSPHAKHFPNPAAVQVTTTVSANQPMKARFHAEAGATKDLAAVMVKDLVSGAWTSGPVAADGSFDLDVGQVGRGGAEDVKYAVWFEAKDGTRFPGGQLGGFWLENRTRPLSHHVEGTSPLRA